MMMFALALMVAVASATNYYIKPNNNYITPNIMPNNPATSTSNCPPVPTNHKAGTDACSGCCYWARQGQCDANKEWMRPYCQESCGTMNCKADGSQASCTVKLHSSCGGTGAPSTVITAPVVANKPAVTTKPAAPASSSSHIINLLIKPQLAAVTVKPTVKTTAKPTITAAPASNPAGAPQKLILLVLNPGTGTGGTGGTGGAAVTTTTTTTTAAPAVAPRIILVQLPANIAGIAANPATVTTTTTAKPAAVGTAGTATNPLAALGNLSNVQLILLTPSQRRARARALARLAARRNAAKRRNTRTRN